MKLFAITPDNIHTDQLIGRLPEIRKRGATHLYLRLSCSTREMRRLIDAAVFAEMVPVISHSLYMRDKPGNCGVHFKSSELNLLDQRLSAQPLIKTVSTHSSVEVRFALHAGADYVYVSPVFEPLSKHDERQLFPHADLRKLIAAHGERIVLLGGITEKRIKMLSDEFQHDFSAAGITFFFSECNG
jgi:hypothetical protein